MTTLRLRLLIRLRPVLRFINKRILHADDSPQRIARGIAAGIFTAWLPFFGLHIFITLLVAAVLRANKAMALLFIWVSNPLTAVFIYYPSYRVGRLIMSVFRKSPPIEPKQIENWLTEAFSTRHVFLNIFTIEFWKQLWIIFSHIGFEMLLGGIFLGLIAAYISYLLSLTIITRFRIRRQHRRKRRASKVFPA